MKWEHLLPKDGPVCNGLEGQEVVYAKDQPEFLPLRSLRGRYPEVQVTSRWSPSPAARKIIAEGGDIFLTLSTFGNPLLPIQLAVSDEPEDWYFRQYLGVLDRPKEDRDDLPPQPDRSHG